MNVTVERLRWWLVASAVLLLLVIGSFLGYARYRAHRFLTELPRQLGADIRQDTNGFTYSQSVGSKTLFTLHAAKAVQRKDGKYTLHDVGISVYGRTANQAHKDRADRIYGSEFEYDQASGVIRAVGRVHIDLQAPSSEVHDPTSDAPHATGKEDADLIHVETSGLVFLQKLGVAATDERVEFQYKEMQGEALGAEYDTDTGTLILRNDVHMHGVQNGRPLTLIAASAQMDRAQNIAELKEPKLTLPEESVASHVAHMTLRQEGSPRQITLDGDVMIRSAVDGDVDAPHAVMQISPTTNRVENAHLFGGLRYTRLEESGKTNGSASDARIVFDSAGHAKLADLQGQVRLQENDTNANGPARERDLAAETMHLQLAALSAGKLGITEAIARGGARATMLSPATAKTAVAGQMQKSSIAADELIAHGTGAAKVDISRVEGHGNTVVETSDGVGGSRRSTGDVLEVRLRPVTKQHGVATQKAAIPKATTQKAVGSLAGTDSVESAVQSGHVVIVQHDGVAKKPAAQKKDAGTFAMSASGDSRAVADRAEYDGTTQQLTLTGSPMVEQGGVQIAATRIRMLQQSGDAYADGDVKATYVSEDAAKSDNNEPMHVIAEHAQLLRTNSRAVFTGGARSARLWQGASQVEAPVLEMEQERQRLLAHGVAGSTGDAMPVRSAFANAPATDKKPGVAHDAKSGGMVRVRSRELVYDERKAQFTGGVVIQSAEGTVHADRADAMMHTVQESGATKVKKSGSAPSGFGGSVESMVAEGNVRIDQPGRTGTGERLTYSAAQNQFELTGTPDKLPVLTDAQRGEITGTSLIFHTGDDSVVISGAPEKKVRTKTLVKRQMGQDH